jgi:intracellular sulfur oxidation DsrE/DsrF family protein
LNTDDPKIIGATLRNISTALEDPRLKGKLTVELVAFSGGWEVFNKDNQYGEKLLELKRKGVILSQCHNTLVERHIQTSQLLPYVSIVPSGNGELIIRQAQGWSIVKP